MASTRFHDHPVHALDLIQARLADDPDPQLRMIELAVTKGLVPADGLSCQNVMFASVGVAAYLLRRLAACEGRDEQAIIDFLRIAVIEGTEQIAGDWPSADPE